MDQQSKWVLSFSKGSESESGLTHKAGFSYTCTRKVTSWPFNDWNFIMNERISVDPNICHGQACIKGVLKNRYAYRLSDK
jgi:hypothetical protein